MDTFYPKEPDGLNCNKSWNLVGPVLTQSYTYNNDTDSLLNEDRSAPIAQQVMGVLKDFMAKKAEDIKENYAWHQIVKIRQRRLFTRSNTLRLRYIALYTILLSGGIYLLQDSVTPNNLEASPLPESAQILALDENAATDVIVPEAKPDLAQAQTAEIEQKSEALAIMENLVPDGFLSLADMIKKKPTPKSRTLEIATGGTLSGVLERAGLDKTETYYAVKAMSEEYDPRHLKPGQKVKVTYKPDTNDVMKFAVELSPVKKVTVTRAGEKSYNVDIREADLINRTYAFSADIETSLYGSALRAGIPANVIAEMIRLYSWNVDFQRDIRQGDKIEIYYQVAETEDGRYAENPEVLFANLGVGGRDKPIYRYKMKDGFVDYFSPDGRSIKKTLMRTPVDGARLSSGFGMRHHPVLGYNKMHKGTDFAAPTGTPIYAAGDGTIEYMGKNGGYGNYVRIRHNSTLKTAYAHMSKFAKGKSKGERVKQGEVIGYIGTTGRSTGPHLHYEVLVNNVQKNPRSVDVPTGEELKGTELANFKAKVNAMKNQYAALSGKLKLAENHYE